MAFAPLYPLIFVGGQGMLVDGAAASWSSHLSPIGPGTPVAVIPRSRRLPTCSHVACMSRPYDIHWHNLSTPQLPTQTQTHAQSLGLSHKVNGDAIAGGVAGALFVIAAAGAITFKLFLRRRFHQLPWPSAPLPGRGSEFNRDRDLGRLAIRQTSKIMCDHWQWQSQATRKTWTNPAEASTVWVKPLAPGASGAALETKVEGQLQMLAAEQLPPGYYTTVTV
ncbi:hypothetical protein GGX14DRAFT_404148 [Mycena pura]|uniref:Uncharacterized protein n=1 Tax=Mycena pura TaxID=153505 RepID=A0AAD6UUQ9_9AGAR|nr:hypothetical protein GGX14DRAFT_404148 [Mycena pura]